MADKCCAVVHAGACTVPLKSVKLCLRGTHDPTPPLFFVPQRQMSSSLAFSLIEMESLTEPGALPGCQAGRPPRPSNLCLLTAKLLGLQAYSPGESDLVSCVCVASVLSMVPSSWPCHVILLFTFIVCVFMFSLAQSSCWPLSGSKCHKTPNGAFLLMSDGLSTSKMRYIFNLKALCFAEI